MPSYQATPKGLIRGATINIEELLAGGNPNDQQRAQIRESCEQILNILGFSGQRELDPGETAQSLLDGINVMLDAADAGRRDLDAIEAPIVADYAQALLGIYSK